MAAAAQELAALAGAAGFAGFAGGVVLGPGGEGTFAAAGAAATRVEHAARTRTGRRIIPSLVSSVRAVAFRLSRVRAEIDPEPNDTERQAILAALEAASADEPNRDPYRSRWREAGLDETPDASDEG
jgi:hypothetical protein